LKVFGKFLWCNDEEVIFIHFWEWRCFGFLVYNGEIDIVGECEFVFCRVIENGIDSYVEDGMVVVIVKSASSGVGNDFSGVAGVLLVDVFVLLCDC